MRSNKGFTLIEVVMVFTLTVILAFVFGVFIVTGAQNWVLISQREIMINSTRNSMNRMTAEMRRIRKPQNITTSEASECGFIDISGQTVDFKQSGTNLLRNGIVLATGLADPGGLQFSYLNASGIETPVKQDMRSIRVLLFISSAGRGVSLESSARIRNLQ